MSLREYNPRVRDESQNMRTFILHQHSFITLLPRQLMLNSVLVVWFNKVFLTFSILVNSQSNSTTIKPPKIDIHIKAASSYIQIFHTTFRVHAWPHLYALAYWLHFKKCFLISLVVITVHHFVADRILL